MRGWKGGGVEAKGKGDSSGKRETNDDEKKRKVEKRGTREKREAKFAWGGTFTGHLEFGTPPLRY